MHFAGAGAQPMAGPAEYPPASRRGDSRIARRYGRTNCINERRIRMQQCTGPLFAILCIIVSPRGRFVKRNCGGNPHFFGSLSFARRR